MSTEADAVERRLLGGMMRNAAGAADVVGTLREADFRNDTHRWLFRAIAGLVERRAPIELTSVAEEVHARGWVGHLGGPGQAEAWLLELYDCEPTGVNLPWYAEQVRNKAVKRQLYDASCVIGRAAKDRGKAADEAVAEAERLVYAISEGRPSLAGHERHVREVVDEVWDRVDARSKSQGGCGGIPTGFRYLDRVLAGLHRAELVVVAARPGVGKTTMGLAFAVNATLNEGLPTLFLSLEQPRAELVERAICSLAEVDSQVVRQGRMNPDESRRFHGAGDRLRAAPLVLNDLATQRVGQIASSARKMAREGGLQLLVVDYLQLVEPESKRDARHEQVAGVSRRLKLLARELNVPVVVMAQLNREMERRVTVREPRLSDLRESGSIEADADVVLLLHQPKEDGKELRGIVPKEGKKELKVIVAKNRNGPTDSVLLYHNAATGRLADEPPTPFANN